MSTEAQVVVVTAAGTGIGRAPALELARAGHRVYAGLREIDGRDRSVSAT